MMNGNNFAAVLDSGEEGKRMADLKTMVDEINRIEAIYRDPAARDAKLALDRLQKTNPDAFEELIGRAQDQRQE